MHKLAYSVDEVAIVLGVCRRTVFNEIEDGRLPSFKLRRRTLISDEALKEYIRKKEQESAAEAV